MNKQQLKFEKHSKTQPFCFISDWVWFGQIVIKRLTVTNQPNNCRQILIQMMQNPDWSTEVGDITFFLFPTEPRPLQTHEESAEKILKGENLSCQKSKRGKTLCSCRAPVCVVRKTLKMLYVSFWNEWITVGVCSTPSNHTRISNPKCSLQTNIHLSWPRASSSPLSVPIFCVRLSPGDWPAAPHSLPPGLTANNSSP